MSEDNQPLFDAIAEHVRAIYRVQEQETDDAKIARVVASLEEQIDRLVERLYGIEAADSVHTLSEMRTSEIVLPKRHLPRRFDPEPLPADPPLHLQRKIPAPETKSLFQSPAL